MLSLSSSRLLPVLLGLATLSGLLLPPQAQADTIRIRADDWCPYNCDPASDRPGYMIEIAREVFKAAGHDVDYQTLNWVRAVEDTRGGRYEAIVGATAEEAAGFVLSPPLGLNRDGYVMRRGSRIDPEAPGALDGLVVGFIRGYEYVGPIAEFIERNKDDPRQAQAVSGDDALETNLKKLVAGRIDLTVGDVSRLRQVIAERGLTGDVEIVYESSPEPVHIAFSAKDPRAASFARLFERELERMRATGELDLLMRRYGLEDWQ